MIAICRGGEKEKKKKKAKTKNRYTNFSPPIKNERSQLVNV
jgi:hypothetical protein